MRKNCREWKGIYVNSFFFNLKKKNFNYLKSTKITIQPFMLNYKFKIYNGRHYSKGSFSLHRGHTGYKFRDFVRSKIIGHIHKKKKK